MHTINSRHKQGGGITILYRPEHHIMRLENSQQYTTLEVGAWATMIRNTLITMLGIYHPPLACHQVIPM